AVAGDVLDGDAAGEAQRGALVVHAGAHVPVGHWVSVAQRAGVGVHATGEGGHGDLGGQRGGVVVAGAPDVGELLAAHPDALAGHPSPVAAPGDDLHLDVVEVVDLQAADDDDGGVGGVAPA